MRIKAIVVALGVVSIGAVALAASAAAGVIQTFGISTPPAKAGKPMALNVNESTADSAGPDIQPPPLRRQTIRLNKGGTYNARQFPRCKRMTLLNTRKCPADTKIGTGRATAVAKPLVDLVGASLTLWNGEKQNGRDTVYIYAIPELGPNLLTIGEVSKQPSGPYDYLLDFRIDPIQTVTGAPDASVTSVKTKTPISYVTKTKNGRKTKIPLIVAPRKCTGRWVGKAEFTYQRSGEPEIVKTVAGSVPCEK